jgi:hypothetical protein
MGLTATLLLELDERLHFSIFFYIKQTKACDFLLPPLSFYY